MKKNQKSVSVIIPYFKAHDTIERAVESVLAQTRKVKETIIINDCSNTIEDDKKLAALNQIEGVKVVSLKENIGCGPSRNKGIEVATGEYLAFLDSDDAWTKDKIEVQMKVMEETNAYFSAHQSEQFDQTAVDQDAAFTTQPIKLLPILLKNKIPVRSVIMKNDGQYQFEPGMRYVEDLMMWGRLLGDHKKGVFINKVMCYSFKEDFGDSGLTANLKKMHEGVLYVFYALYKAGKINKATFVIACQFEKLKYQIRKIKVLKRQHLNS
ncbi:MULTISPECIES: glycosyltransferase family 2 protein [Staphylococcus]|uniref:glycosyltransferase family 2 protein n=1 Tax=Staphylococcus TaxID=1279 RepID=UPI0021D13CB0|nr:glycosyltransferase family 2 protein [Staphylococcus sp. IVB6181]UXV34167.1 glycosyltransferase [Staphylococcus sp. IVB6181]